MSRVVRKTVEIHGYDSIYGGESNPLPSFETSIYKKTFYGRRILVLRYYMIYTYCRTVGIMESPRMASVKKLYGDVVWRGYKFQKEVKPKSLKRMYPFLFE